MSAPLTQHEADWLPELAGSLLVDVPVDVPAAVRVGRPALGYPWTWLVCPWFDGRPVADVPLHRRGRIAGRLGTFVAALHRPAPVGAPQSPWRGISLAELEPRVIERLDRLPGAEAGVLERAWNRSANVTAHAGPPSWLHGDLHPLNLLADLLAGHTDPEEEPALTAVIDWGDLTQGDPATDLAVAWLAFDQQGRERFRRSAAARHRPDDPVWDRARAWAVSFAALLLLDAEPGTTLEAIGRHTLAQLR